jgi:hypothetical protein
MIRLVLMYAIAMQVAFAASTEGAWPDTAPSSLPVGVIKEGELDKAIRLYIDKLISNYKGTAVIDKHEIRRGIKILCNSFSKEILNKSEEERLKHINYVFSMDDKSNITFDNVDYKEQCNSYYIRSLIPICHEEGFCSTIYNLLSKSLNVWARNKPWHDFLIIKFIDQYKLNPKVLKMLYIKLSYPDVYFYFRIPGTNLFVHMNSFKVNTLTDPIGHLSDGETYDNMQFDS